MCEVKGQGGSAVCDPSAGANRTREAERWESQQAKDAILDMDSTCPVKYRYSPDRLKKATSFQTDDFSGVSLKERRCSGLCLPVVVKITQVCSSAAHRDGGNVPPWNEAMDIPGADEALLWIRSDPRLIPDLIDLEDELHTFCSQPFKPSVPAPSLTSSLSPIHIGMCAFNTSERC
ncbi:unnamed protein product [Leuciscus chuanchicus]